MFAMVVLCFRDDSAEVDVYNPLKNEWDKIDSMTQVNIQYSSSHDPATHLSH